MENPAALAGRSIGAFTTLGWCAASANVALELTLIWKDYTMAQFHIHNEIGSAFKYL